MIQDIWWIWMWAFAGGAGAPFQWTITVSFPGYRDVYLEASLSKLVLTGAGHGKATVLHAERYSGQPPPMQNVSNNWGIDGSPIRFVPQWSWMTFALEVSGVNTYAAMTGKVYLP